MPATFSVTPAFALNEKVKLKCFENAGTSSPWVYVVEQHWHRNNGDEWISYTVSTHTTPDQEMERLEGELQASGGA